MVEPSNLRSPVVSSRRFLRLAVAVLVGRALVAAPAMPLTWDTLPALPPAAGQVKQPGVASPFVGVHQDVLIVAGGANFPERMPWDGGAKVWWDDIGVLERRPGGEFRWVTDRVFKLPRAIGYGVSVSVPEGVICAGGSDAERCHADVYLLAWDASARELRRTALPSLPEPLANMAGALVGQVFYVAGGQHVMKGATPSTAFWALDWSKRDRPGEFKWKVLPTWPGPARVLPVAAAQAAPQGAQFFLFSGRMPRAGQPTQLLRDAYAFDPASRRWRTLPPVGGGDGCSVMAGTAAAVSTGEILLFGGDRGERFAELEGHDLAIEAARQKLAGAAGSARSALEAEIERRLAAKRAIYLNHPGFGREVFAFDPRRETWRIVDRSPVAPQVTTLAVAWNGAIVIPSGEIRPGVRTPEIVRVIPRSP